MLSPEDRVRIQLERSLAQDATSRARIIKRESRAILPVFMAGNGRIKRLGQGESRAIIAPNLHYVPGEEMRPIPVRGGLPMVDNRSLIPPTAPTPTGFIDISSNLRSITYLGKSSTSSVIMGASADEGGNDLQFVASYDLNRNLRFLYSLPSGDYPYTDNPLIEPSTGTGTVSFAVEPFFSFRYDFTDIDDPEEEPTIQFTSPTITVGSDNWGAIGGSIRLNLNSYLKIGAGSFDLINSLTHTFTQSSPSSPNMFSTDPYATNLLEAYITWEFV
jgi:hypothetical protein